MSSITRRSVVAGGIAAAGAALGVVARRFGLVPPDWKGVYGPGETLTYAAHRTFGRHALAREFPRSMISAAPYANTVAPPTEAFARHQAAGFATWRLAVTGSVERPASFSIADLRAMERRSHITEVACEEGWSYIAEWAGTPLSAILQAVGVRPGARWVVYHSSDAAWIDSIDLDEALHPQTLLAWEMNGAELSVPFGGPLRMRVPRQLGYKSVKYVDRIIVADTLEGFVPGSYSWYAGI